MRLYKIFIATGTMLILSALFLCLHNFMESEKAYKISQENLSELKKLIPEPPDENVSVFDYDIPEEDIFKPYDEDKNENPKE